MKLGQVLSGLDICCVSGLYSAPPVAAVAIGLLVISYGHLAVGRKPDPSGRRAVSQPIIGIALRMMHDNRRHTTDA